MESENEKKDRLRRREDRIAGKADLRARLRGGRLTLGLNDEGAVGLVLPEELRGTLDAMTPRQKKRWVARRARGL